MLPVVDDCSSETPGRINAGAGNGNGGQMNQKHCKPNGKRSQNRDVRISGISLGIGGGEDGVDENEGTDNLSTETAALGVARGDEVRTTELLHVGGALEALHDARAADGTKALHYDVEYGSGEGQFPGQEKPERHRRINVSTGDAGGAVDEGEDHAAEGPSDTLNANGGAFRRSSADSHHCQDGDVEEQESGHKLRDSGSVK